MIKIVTDSTSDIPYELVKKFNIEIIPLTINLGDEVRSNTLFFIITARRLYADVRLFVEDLWWSNLSEHANQIVFES